MNTDKNIFRDYLRIIVCKKSKLFARQSRDKLAGRSFILLSTFPVFVLVLIAIALFVRAQPILEYKTITELLHGQVWKPAQGEFGYYPFIVGTVWVTFVSMVLAVPICLLSSIYLSEYTPASMRAFMKPLLDILAAIPSVVYGVWGILVIVPLVQSKIAPFIGRWLGFIPIFTNNNPTGFNILSGSIVLAVMVLPFIIAINYEVLHAVPCGLKEASLALGATRFQTIKHALLPKVFPGLLASIVLGASRALGETMAVIMVVGNVAQVPNSIFDPAYPLTALIANNYGEMLSIPLYDAALLGAALVLLIIVLVFNFLALIILRKIMGDLS